MRWILPSLSVAALLSCLALAILWLRPDWSYRLAMSLEHAMAGVRSSSIVVGDNEYRYWRGGNGPTLLLLHGFNADRNHWTRITMHLRSHFDVIAPDLLGFGDSTRPQDVSYAVPAQAERLVGFMDALELSEPVYLGGSSMGGYIAAALTQKQPARVAGLLLFAPGGVADAPYSEMFETVAEGGNPLIPEKPADFADTMDIVFAKRPFIPPPVETYLGRRLAERRELGKRIFDDLRYRSPPLEELLEGVTLPALIVWGARDRVLHPQGASVLADLLPQAKVVLIPEVGHLPMLEAPAMMANLVLSFATEQGWIESAKDIDRDAAVLDSVYFAP